MAKRKKKSKLKTDACCAPSFHENESRTVRIRKIDNGFIVSEDSSGKEGYKSKETFTPRKPKIDMQIREAKAREKRLKNVQL